MTTALATTNKSLQAIERVLIHGDLSQLSESERLSYYRAVCESLGLNYLTSPFAYIKLEGKLILYAKREATEQLRKLYAVSVQIVARELLKDVYVVTARATLPDGRCDESIGAVPLTKEGGSWKTSANGKRYFESDGTQQSLTGEAFSNAIMKAETKAKRRVTLSICGLAMLDELEAETIPNATKQQVPELPPARAEVYSTWKTPADAVNWGATMLPDLTPPELQELFDSVPAVDGKKAAAFVEKVLEMAATF